MVLLATYWAVRMLYVQVSQSVEEVKPKGESEGEREGGRDCVLTGGHLAPTREMIYRYVDRYICLQVIT